MSLISGDKNIVVDEASAFGASETHGIRDPPIPLRRLRRRKSQMVLMPIPLLNSHIFGWFSMIKGPKPYHIPFGAVLHI